MFSSKYRSNSFSEVAGDSATTEVIKEQLQRGTLPNFIILTGPPGAAKTTHSYLMAKRLLCRDPKGYEPCNECAVCVSLNKTLYEAGRGVSGIPVHKFTLDIDNDEEYMQTINQAVTIPATTRFGIKVILLEELHVVSHNNQKKLQTPLENIPDSVYVIVSTSEPNNIIQPIKGRASIYNLPPASKEAMMERLLHVASLEGHSLPKKRAELIAKASLSMREALNQLEREISAPNTAMQLFIEESNMKVEKYIDYISAVKGGTPMTIEFIELLDDKVAFLRKLPEFFITFLKVKRGYTAGLPRETVKIINEKMLLYTNEVIMEILELTLKMGQIDDIKASTYLLLVGYKLQNDIFKGSDRSDKEMYQRVEEPKILSSEEESRLNPIALMSCDNIEDKGITDSLYNELMGLGLVGTVIPEEEHKDSGERKKDDSEDDDDYDFDDDDYDSDNDLVFDDL